MKAKEIILSIVGILCLLYSVAIYFVQSGTATFLMWAVFGICFFALAVGVYVRLWIRIPGIIRRIVILLLLLGVTIFLIVEGCIISGFFAKGEDGLDYIVALGAQVYEDGPSNVLKYRLDAAYDYLIQNEDTICIVSGGQGTNEPFPEAQGMYEYLVKKGISKERILLEDKSGNTVENLTNSSALFDKKENTVGIVTNNFHIFRSLHLAKKIGIEHVYGIAANTNPLFLVNNMVREFFGIGKDLLCGNLL